MLKKDWPNWVSMCPESSLSTLHLHAELAGTEVLGPGRRYAVWVQGCPFDCPGCMTQDARPFTSGQPVEIAALAARILATPDLEGITLSGGEPFAQAPALATLLAQVKAQRDLGVMIYSGYTLPHLRRLARTEAGVAALLTQCDLLIDGPYQVRHDDGGRWRGSANQRAHCLTPRYRQAVAECFGQSGRQVELHIYDSEWLLAGVPGPKALAHWRALTGALASDNCSAPHLTQPNEEQPHER